MNTMNIVAQAIIAVCGVGAIYLVGRKDRVRRWGYVLGLCAQPAWLYTTISHEQYGIAALCLLYTLSWANGLKNHWRTPCLSTP